MLHDDESNRVLHYTRPPRKRWNVGEILLGLIAAICGVVLILVAAGMLIFGVMDFNKRVPNPWGLVVILLILGCAGFASMAVAVRCMRSKSEDMI